MNARGSRAAVPGRRRGTIGQCRRRGLGLAEPRDAGVMADRGTVAVGSGPPSIVRAAFFIV
jgi:hypothetical protein